LTRLIVNVRVLVEAQYHDGVLGSETVAPCTVYSRI